MILKEKHYNILCNNRTRKNHQATQHPVMRNYFSKAYKSHDKVVWVMKFPQLLLTILTQQHVGAKQIWYKTKKLRSTRSVSCKLQVSMIDITTVEPKTAVRCNSSTVQNL